MRILLTGSTGLIGGELKKQLIKKISDDPSLDDNTLYCVSRKKSGDNQVIQRSDNRFGPISSVVHYEGDLLDKSFITYLMRATSPHFIFHLAAKATVKDETPGELFEQNVLMTEYLVRNAPRDCHFVYTSSATVYGSCKDEDSLPFKETDLPNPSSLYAATKIASEVLIQARHNLGYIKGLIIRPVANVGVGATHGILKDFIRKALDDNPIFPILDTKPSYKPYLHVEDCAQAIMDLTFKGLAGIYNVSTYTPLYSDRVAKIVMQELNVDKPIQFVDNNWEGDDRFVKISFEKAEKSGCRLKHWYSDDAVRAVVRQYKENL